MPKIKQWFLSTFFWKRILLENILLQLGSLHHHFDRMESFYMMVNNIKVEEEIVEDKK